MDLISLEGDGGDGGDADDDVVGEGSESLHSRVSTQNSVWLP